MQVPRIAALAVAVGRDETETVTPLAEPRGRSRLFLLIARALTIRTVGLVLRRGDFSYTNVWGQMSFCTVVTIGMESGEGVDEESSFLSCSLYTYDISSCFSWNVL